MTGAVSASRAGRPGCSGRLARTGDPITHDLLDDLPRTRALRYISEVLVDSGILPARNEHLERLAPWLEHLLHDKPAPAARSRQDGRAATFILPVTTSGSI